ncbi:TPA: hypothetical protein RJX60_002753 [Legionella pneumophila]|nr:hypothetical protein [Legionella pneumophila]HDV6650027.1 hypothetical protein [Legionella pneumophila]HDV6737972.1 hypothetical protein [Legionella pneumophila]
MNKKSILLMSMLLVSPLSMSGTVGEAQQDGKRFVFSASAIYGSLSDGTLDSIPYADTIKSSGLISSGLFNVDSRWGYSLSAGYLFGPEFSYDLVLSYTNITNHGSSITANSVQGDLMDNRLSLILKDFSGLQMIGPALAVVNSDYDYQNAELITHRTVPSRFAKPLHYTRYYGAKATEIVKEFTARYSGESRFGFFNSPIQPLTDSIKFQAKYKGIGPKAGAGVYWDVNRFITIGGDISFSVLAGNSKSHLNERVEITGPEPILDFPNTGGRYAYFLNHPSSLWVSPVLGANLVVASHFNLNNDSVIGVEGGIGSEQYWSMHDGERYGLANGGNRLSISERFSIRNVFIKASYIV